jgi:hypothetical protein
MSCVSGEITGDLAKILWRECPVAFCHPDVHPWIADAWAEYRTVRMFGLPPASRTRALDAAMVVIDQEVKALSEVERKRPKIGGR